MTFSRVLFYHKLVLRKVSFDAELFHKELEKAYLQLSYEESLMLNRWLVGYFKENPHLRLRQQYV